jgi:hypothetical protein
MKAIKACGVLGKEIDERFLAIANVIEARDKALF